MMFYHGKMCCRRKYSTVRERGVLAITIGLQLCSWTDIITIVIGSPILQAMILSN
jgi:hypothetical protein